MSITVADCLKLGILKDATVIAGFNGLDRIVDSVSVFEFDGFRYKSLSNILVGNEMAIGAFSYFKNKGIDKFAKFIKELIKSGLSCIVVFYIGFVLERVPEEILAIADKEDIPIIAFPPITIHSYADVIMTVAEAIINDRNTNTMFISDVIDQMLGMNENLQNNQTVLNLLSNKVGSDLILTDNELVPFIWAMNNNSLAPAELLNEVRKLLLDQLPQTPKTFVPREINPHIHLRFQPIRTTKLMGYLIAVNPINLAFNIDSATQASEVLRLFFRIWRFSSTKMSELNALLEGGASSAIHSRFQIRHLTIIRGSDDSPVGDDMNQPEIIQSLKKYNEQEFYNKFNFTLFDGSVVVAGDEAGNDTLHKLQKVVLLLKKYEPLSIGECNVLPGQSIHQTYTMIRQALPIAHKIFPGARVFGEEKIQFAYGLYLTKYYSSAEIDSLTQILSQLQKDSDWEKHFTTLSTLYLDCDGLIGEAAIRLGVHINTIKYRLQNIQKKSLLNMDSLLTQSRLSLALAIIRLRLYD